MASYGFAGYGAASPQGGYSQNGTFVPYGGYAPAPQPREGGGGFSSSVPMPFSGGPTGDSAPYSGVHNNRGWQAVGRIGGGWFGGVGAGTAPTPPPPTAPGAGYGYLQPNGSFGSSPAYVNQLNNGGGAGTGVAAPQGSVYDQLANSNQLSYGQGLAGYAARQQDVINNLDVLGQNERSVLMDQYAQEKAQAHQYALSHGLGDSSTRQSMIQGVNAQRDEALRRVENEIRGKKLDLQSQLSGDLLGYAERQSAAQAQAALEQQRLSLMAQQMQQEQRRFEASLDLQRQDMFGRYNRQTATNPLPLYGWPGGGAGPGNGGYNFSQIYRG